MKITPLLFVISLACNFHCHSQPAAGDQLEEVQKKLMSGIKVSKILTNKTYLSLHPETAFRNLIRDHAEPGHIAIATADEPGKKIHVICQVSDENDRPIPDVLVYLYQTDAKGWYGAGSPHIQGNEGDFRHARLFGYVKTDSEGRFNLYTVKPSGYPQTDLPAHIHVHLNVNGYQEKDTEFLFDDDPRLIGKIRENNPYPIAKPETAPAGMDQQFSYRIQLQKKP